MPLDTPLIAGDLGFHYHTGGHTITVEDWKAFLDFADRHLKRDTDFRRRALRRLVQNRVGERPDFFDLDAHAVPGTQPAPGSPGRADAVGRAGKNHSSG